MKKTSKILSSLLGRASKGLGFSVCTLICAGVPAFAQYSNYSVGNTYGDQTKAIGGQSQVLWTDGSGVITAAYYSESTHEVQTLSATDGTCVNNYSGTHYDSPNYNVDGRAITGDSGHIWASTANSSGQVACWSRTSLQQAGYFNVPQDVAGYVGGLAISGNSLYVSVPTANVVLIYDISSSAGSYVGRFTVTNPDALATDSAGHIWVAQNNSNAPQVTLYTSSGSSLLNINLPTNSKIGQISNFTADGDDAVVVADRGPDLNVKVYYYLVASPGAGIASQGQVGTTGGVFASNTIAGQSDNSHFTDVRGVAADSHGNIYVLCQTFGDQSTVSNVLVNSAGTIVRRFTKTAHTTWGFAWCDVGLHFEGIGDVDPATANGSTSQDIYTGGERFSLNPSNGTSGLFSVLVNPFKYPNDPRLTSQNDFAFIRRVSGGKILFTTTQNPGDDYNGGTAQDLNVYTFNSSTDGEVAIPSGIKLNAYTGFSIAANGDLYGVSGNKIYLRPFTGSASSPSWGTEQSWTFNVGNTSTLLKRCAYDGTNLYVTAFSNIYGPGPEGDQGLGGRILLRLSYGGTSWNEQARTLLEFSDVTPSNLNVPQTLTQAGNYVFVGYYTVGTGGAASTRAYPKQFANNANSILSPTVNFTTTNSSTFYPGNDVDSYYGTTASYNTNGTYTVLKDDYNDYKLATYIWKP